MHKPHHFVDYFALLNAPNAEFLPSAFRAIFGREPDVAGLAHYAQRLQLGARRVLILAELRNSAEGLAHAPDAPSPELDSLLARYRKVRSWPLGRWRWVLLPHYKTYVSTVGFDWNRWIIDYKEKQELQRILSRHSEEVSSPPEVDQKLSAIEHRVDVLSSALQQAISLLQAKGVPSEDLAKIQHTIASETYPKLPQIEVSFAARSIYVQLLSRMGIANH